MSFHGSYRTDDVQFLLQPLELEPTPAALREQLMQSGQRHYSELLPPESPPSTAYLGHYEAALRRNGPLMGRHIAALARTLYADQTLSPGPVLVSLARAGTPVGVLLRRALKMLGVDGPHYSVSIIRDRGIDAVAMDHILEAHGPERLVFVDGWTGKGAIRKTLTEALSTYTTRRGITVPDRLLVLADLAGVADWAATEEDYVIPSAILNAVVSGLVSRTVLNDAVIASGGFHGCRFYSEWAPHDLSLAFVDTITDHVARSFEADAPLPAWTSARRLARHAVSEACIVEAMARFDVEHLNRLKPGAGEATRAVLRRIPHRVVVRDPQDPEVAHLIHLCAEKQVPVERWPSMAWRALTVIKRS
ncbi:MAG: cysteine protease StiP domain-containing protein [Bradymonadia bacterium]